MPSAPPGTNAVAHDFNNMLTAIIGSAELLNRHERDNPAQEKLLGTIREAAGSV